MQLEFPVSLTPYFYLVALTHHLVGSNLWKMIADLQLLSCLILHPYRLYHLWVCGLAGTCCSVVRPAPALRLSRMETPTFWLTMDPSLLSIMHFALTHSDHLRLHRPCSMSRCHSPCLRLIRRSFTSSHSLASYDLLNWCLCFAIRLHACRSRSTPIQALLSHRIRHQLHIRTPLGEVLDCQRTSDSSRRFQ